MAPMLRDAMGPDLTWERGHRRRTGPADPPVRHRAGRARSRGCAALAERQRAGRGRQPVRHPRAGARGVPDRPGRLAGHGLPRAAELGGDLRPGPRRADGRRDRRHRCAALGVHQGLAPVLDVVRDLRWGRVEETIGEDPYLVGTIGSAYVRGLESAGVVATLKHFVGYSASRAGRNLAPVVDRAARAGRRDPAAVRDGAARPAPAR